MSGDTGESKYGVSTAFEKVLSHNIPGVLFAIVILMFIDLVSDKKFFEDFSWSLDWQLFAILLISFVFLGFMLGLMIDELHHILIEAKIYLPRAKKDENKREQVEFLDLEGKKCTESYYLPFMGLDLYKYNLKHFYSYSEFDANIGIVLLPTSIIFPFYLNYYLKINYYILWGIGIGIFSLAILMFVAGYYAFCDYYSSFSNTLRGLLKKENIQIVRQDSEESPN